MKEDAKPLVICGVLVVIGLLFKLPSYLARQETLAVIGTVIIMGAVIYYCFTLMQKKS